MQRGYPIYSSQQSRREDYCGREQPDERETEQRAEVIPCVQCGVYIGAM